jgi:hypothetical protein
MTRHFVSLSTASKELKMTFTQEKEEKKQTLISITYGIVKGTAI